MSVKLALACVLTAAMGAFAFAQDPPRAGMPGRPPAGTPGPWDNDVDVYRVSTTGQTTKVATFPRAGVPTLARMKDGRLIAAHQHFPADSDADFDKVAVHFSSDEGVSWTPAQVIRLTGLPDTMRFPFDPTLVPLPDGRVRLYFTSLHGRRFDEDLPAIYSAISSNGVDYTVEPGQRFGIDGRIVIDCAVALHNGVFHLFSPDNGAQPARGQRGAPPQPADGIGYHATSPDGLTFTRVDDVKVDGRRHWLGSVQSDGTSMTFFGTGGGVWMATSRDGRAWELTRAVQVQGADPGAVAAKGGGWIMLVTGPPRNGRGRG